MSVFDDRVEVKSLFPVEPIGIHSALLQGGTEGEFLLTILSASHHKMPVLLSLSGKGD